MPEDCTSSTCREQVVWLIGKWRACEARAQRDAEKAEREIRHLRRRLRSKRRRRAAKRRRK